MKMIAVVFTYLLATKLYLVNYSDGLGQQMIYLYQDFIGDTLMVYGCTENNTCSSLNFIVY